MIIHVDDWDAAHGFYVDVLGLERVDNPEGAGNPLGVWVYRLSGQQINVHVLGLAARAHAAPRRSTRWVVPISPSGRDSCQPSASSCSNSTASPSSLVRSRVTRAKGWGTSVYCRDPRGNEIELIFYATE